MLIMIYYGLRSNNIVCLVEDALGKQNLIHKINLGMVEHVSKMSLWLLFVLSLECSFTCRFIYNVSKMETLLNDIV